MIGARLVDHCTATKTIIRFTSNDIMRILNLKFEDQDFIEALSHHLSVAVEQYAIEEDHCFLQSTRRSHNS